MKRCGCCEMGLTPVEHAGWLRRGLQIRIRVGNCWLHLFVCENEECSRCGMIVGR